MSGIAIFFIAFAAVVATAALIVVYARLRNQKEDIDFDDDIFNDDNSEGEPELYMGPEKDLEGNELENVEIV